MRTTPPKKPLAAERTSDPEIAFPAFAKKPDEVKAHAARMLAMKVGQFPVEAVLVEEKIAIEREFFLSFAIDDAARAPIIIFSAGGGSGIEERAASTRRIPSERSRARTAF
jgi:succinyl-CoA synthetase beta subunit